MGIYAVCRIFSWCSTGEGNLGRQRGSLQFSPISKKGTRASCAVPIGHGPSSAKGTRANIAVPLSRGINSVTGGRVSNAAPLNHGTCASRAAPLSHASLSNEDAATARRPPRRTCSPSPRSDQVVAVGLRCGKANTKTPRSLARLDPVFTRDSSGRSSHQGGVVEISYLVPLLQEG